MANYFLRMNGSKMLDKYSMAYSYMENKTGRGVVQSVASLVNTPPYKAKKKGARLSSSSVLSLARVLFSCGPIHGGTRVSSRV